MTCGAAIATSGGLWGGKPGDGKAFRAADDGQDRVVSESSRQAPTAPSAVRPPRDIGIAVDRGARREDTHAITVRRPRGLPFTAPGGFTPGR
jgi:hypothetical protein